ncbi:uncharacterized protein [Gossypium hirsutum]|uniref:Uncharacterized protein n=1 Tax=Gossypium hirsutum TaxID=3635 RepID=A0ABM3BMK6_GOSHI|nr:uncharacterized protein LOC107957406 [Gossypium hirsutum]XP_040968287.1 uncharacterized protein LOC107957406 [Gossypium hirsutum]
MVLLSTLGCRFDLLPLEESVKFSKLYPLERNLIPSTNPSAQPTLQETLCCPNTLPGKRRQFVCGSRQHIVANRDFLLYWDGRFMVWLMFTSKLTTTNRGLWVNQILT